MFKVPFSEAARKHQTTLDRESYNQEVEIQNLNLKLDPPKKFQFGRAIGTTTRFAFGEDDLPKEKQVSDGKDYNGIYK